MTAAVATSGVMVTADELIQLHRNAKLLGLSLPANRLATHSGGHLSPFRGRGVEFAEVRTYQPGDDVRTIDWRVTARTGQAYTKLFREERERPVLVLVDQSSHMVFGTRVAFKSVVAARAAMLLAWATHDRGDRVGGLVFNDAQHLEVRPTRSPRSVLQLAHALAAQKPPPIEVETTPWLTALERAARLAKPGTLIILISDFYRPTAAAERYLALLRRHCDLVLIFTYDALEAEAPPPNRYRITDGRHLLLMDTANDTFRRQYRNAFIARREYMRELTQRQQTSFIELATHDDVAKMLRQGLGRVSSRSHAAMTRPAS